MALAFLNRCIWRAASSGTGSFVVASAITGYVVPADCDNPAVVNGATYRYFAQSDDLTQWEIGYDDFNTGTSTLPRGNILDSSNAGAAVTFSAAPTVFMGCALAGDVPTVSDVAYDATTWNGNTDVPTKNAIRDKIESMGGGGITNPLTANLDVGGFSIIGADDAVGGTDGGPIVITSGSGTTGAGANITVTAGDGDTVGGGMEFNGGVGASGDGGGISFVAGDGGAGDGGNFAFSGGEGSNNGGGSFLAGGGGTIGNGGPVNIAPGIGAVDGGDVTITLPVAGSGRQGLIIATNVPTSDPTVTDALWNAGGVLVFSGASGVVTNPMSADLDVGDFSIVSGDDGTDGKQIELGAGDAPAGFGGNIGIGAGDGETGGTVTIFAGNGSVNQGGAFAFVGGNGETVGGNVEVVGGTGNTAAGGQIYLGPGAGATDGGDVFIELPAAGTGRQGLIIMTGLPTADPGVPGALWINGTVLEVSP